jgi:class 3 adenylate cyclase
VAEERRVVTILFADVAGSTAMGDALDPEDVRVLLRRYYDIARETVSEHGGILEKFIGDAVVAVFGFPHTHDDDPQRALAAALALRDRVRSDPALGERLPIRLGINTGEVVASRESATGDFPLTGDAVNVTARLQQAAESWGILCGERTVASIRSGFAFGPVIAIDARGKSQPIRALALLGRAAHTPVARRTPLIGRDRDLQQLELAARRALEEQRPFLVSVIAPAGVGKTRLLEEFLERLPGIEPRATVAIAQCLPYGQRLTYWPLRGVLYRLIGVPEDAKPPTVRQAIRDWLDGSGLEAMDREVELLAATVGAGETEVSDRSALLAAWRTFFEIAARRSPLVLVFEDLHWSSDSLLDLFEFVMQPRGDLPLIMIALTRPELLDRRPGWGGGRRNYTSISLEPLSDRDTARLIDQLLDGCPPELVDRIVRHAEGNPFFAGELIRSVAERGIDQLPDTVQATVLARLDQLSPEERRVIQLGSVFGRAFRPPGLLALEPTLERLEEVLDRLLDKDLLRSTGADTFAFRHILIREVAFQTLTRAERGRLHAAAAEWLARLAGEREDSLAELIAYHYREAALIATAQRPGDAETERIREQAVRWLSRAADVATAAAATIEAARHVRSAIELAESNRLPDLYQRLGELSESGERVLDAYHTALRLCREQGRPAVQQLQILAGMLGQYMRMQGSVADRPSENEMAELRRDAQAVASSVDDEKTLAKYLAADAFFPFWISPTGRYPTPGEVAAANASGEKALLIARRLDDVNLQSMALDALSSTQQLEYGGWRKSQQYAMERLAFADRLSLGERIDAYSMVTWGASLLGDLAEAERASAAGLAQVQPGQVPAWTLHLVCWRAYALTLLGKWDEALSLAERARQLWIETGRHSAGYALRGFISAIDIARARQDEGLLDTYRAIFDEISGAFPEGTIFRRWLGYGGADLSTIARAVDEFEPGPFRQMERFERGLSCLLDHDRPPSIEVADRILNYRPGEFPIIEAQALRLIGRINRDTARLTQALELFESADAVPYAARVRCERALITGNREEMNAGLAVFQRLGDLQQLGRFERLQVG